MDVLIHMTCRDSARLAAPLGRALTSRGAEWVCFLTNDAVFAADDADFMAAIDGAKRAVVCEHSWDIHMPGRDSPFERGSQTINSGLMADAARVVSL
ncbi:hypothetical protein GGD81_001797 [Rhodobium orientis]|uniref:Uncharacterized protein n=1 Tax=Rhodobium orientis TaxID=34017 RepID=A0A327K345_9HYPH|nr:hypothetical protein [Rhodobium orientis]MBB4302761.1 hypothetical protein [Rhodobium orientis]MBK5948541.1 hypothetical protein [Rhodobium orientis]RAI29808.1 hypothetical protein CH339_01975 [Rhodobium orientis]